MNNISLQNFISELKHHLRKLPHEDVEEIINDQQDFIREAMAEGKSEEDILKSFGSAKEMADSLIAENKVQKISSADGFWPLVKAILGSIGAVIILAPINFIILLGPVLACFCVVITMLGLGAGFFFGGLAGVYIYFAKVLTITMGAAAHLTAFFTALGFIGLGTIFLFITYYITYGFGQAFVSYFNWNINFIQKNS